MKVKHTFTKNVGPQKPQDMWPSLQFKINSFLISYLWHLTIGLLKLTTVVCS